MKITDIQCVPVQAPGRTLVPILVYTDEGIIGLGEAGLQRRWQAIKGVVEHVKRWLIGIDPMRIEHIWQRLFRGGFYPADRLIGSAIAGIDIALWDIKGQKLGVPIYELLGGRVRDYVQCFLSPTYRSSLADMTMTADASPQSMVALAKECRTDGHKYFRIGLDAQDNRFDGRAACRKLVAQLRAVRDALGDDMELMVDLHARLSPDQAIMFCREIESLNLYLVEDPIRSEHAQGYRHLRQQTRVPLAAGEQWSSKWEFRQAIEEELVDYVRPDLCICCGLTEGKKIAAMAETHLIQLLCHNPLGPVCTAASLHLDLACDNAGPQEILFPPTSILPDVFECAFRLDGTRLTIPMAAGLGVKMHVEAANRHPPDFTEPPHFQRDDGAFTNY